MYDYVPVCNMYVLVCNMYVSIFKTFTAEVFTIKAKT